MYYIKRIMLVIIREIMLVYRIIFHWDFNKRVKMISDNIVSKKLFRENIREIH